MSILSTYITINPVIPKEMTWHPDKPYNDLPLLPPGLVLETTAVLKRCIAARATLAELKQAAAQLTNPSMLINTLPVLEARDSSAIENIVTTTDKLFLLNATNGSVDAATQESLNWSTCYLCSPTAALITWWRLASPSGRQLQPT